MKNIDYKIFVPRGGLNYIKIREKEFLIEEILTVNIHLEDDKVSYWFYVNIDNEEKDALTFLKNKHPKIILLIGNNPYEIHGEVEIINTYHDKKKQEIQFTMSFLVINASDTFNNPRKERKIKNRSTLLDLS